MPGKAKTESNINGGPVHVQLAAAIRGRIQNGFYQDSGKLESENELCAMFERSRPTVRRALDTLVSEGLIQRIPKKGYFLSQPGTRPTDQYRIAVLSDVEIGSQFLNLPSMPSIQTMERLAPLYRLTLQHLYLSSSHDAFDFLMNPSRELSGAVLFRPKPEWVDLILKERRSLLSQGLPFVVMDRNLKNSGIHYVTPDFSQPVRDGLKYLRQLGHDRVGIVLGDVREVYNAEIIETFRETSRMLSLDFNEEFICQIDRYNPFEVSRVLSEFLQPPLPFTSLLVTGGIFLHDTLRFLGENNIRIPDDLSLLVSCQEQMLEPCPHKISVFLQPVKQIVESIFDAVQGLIENRYNGVCQERIPFNFVFGDSCAPTYGPVLIEKEPTGSSGNGVEVE